MSAIQQESSLQVNGTPRSPESGGLGDASLQESLAVFASGVVPALVRGLFVPRRGAMKLLTRLDADGRAITQVLSRCPLTLKEPTLPSGGGPMPTMLDFYSARFTARRR